MSCDDDDSFTTSSSYVLTFGVDTISMDTVFSTVPSSMKEFWVYNRSGEGLRNINVRLEGGNQVGFRVNVDGAYLSSTTGYQISDIEVRNKDSIRVFVELTSALNYGDEPEYIEDRLIFTLESGVQQSVVLNAYSWDADFKSSATIAEDATFTADRPIVVYGTLTVVEGATLTIEAGAQLYFHSDASIEVAGTLLCEGTADANVVLRGDRLDNMFDYLPYDYVSGQWNGVHFLESSYGNVLSFTDIHSAYDGVAADSSAVDRLKLSVENSVIHNCQGTALATHNCVVSIVNTQLSNALGNCLMIDGGIAYMNNCTLAQFYPYDSARDVAFAFTAETYPLLSLVCRNTLVTGYADDEVMGTQGDDATHDFYYYFDHCIIRTPKIETADSVYLVSVTYEEVDDTVAGGSKHFAKIDTDNLRYDFHLSSVSKAVDGGDATTAMTYDRDGVLRDALPDIGAYEYVKEEE